MLEPLSGPSPAITCRIMGRLVISGTLKGSNGSAKCESNAPVCQSGLKVTQHLRESCEIPSHEPCG